MSRISSLAVVCAGLLAFPAMNLLAQEKSTATSEQPAAPVVKTAETNKHSAIAEEKAEHPRIVKAIKELDSAIEYLEKAPHDFGGHKAEAIAASREAVKQLKLALAYRVKVEKAEKEKREEKAEQK